MSSAYYHLPGGRLTALGPDSPFPPLETALQEPNGLLAADGDLSPQRLLSAYRQGIFPWFSAGEPILWWSPDPRMVLFPDALKVSHSLAKRLKKSDYEVRFNTAFREVMLHCANTQRASENGTWINDDIVQAYCALHQSGYAHSAETWINGALVGGLYGVAIGHMFYGESMFHHINDGSKIAFFHLVKQLQARGFGMIDCQMKTAHLSSLGAIEISRQEFATRLKHLTNEAQHDIA